MKRARSCRFVFPVLALVAAVPTLVTAQDEATALKRAIQLFEDGEYAAAQEALAAIDRDKLSPEEQAVRDDYVNRVQVALTMYEKALRDLQDAETALDEQDFDEARRLLQRVVENEYAPEPLRRTASSQLEEIDAREPAPEAPDQPADAPPEPSPTRAKVHMQRARMLIQEADEKVKAARYEEARRLYHEAAQLVPGYPEALEGLQRVDEHLRNIGVERGESLLDRIRRENRINWQRTVAEYRDIERVIRQHVTHERFDEANQLLARARQIVDAGKQFADPLAGYENLRAEAEALAEWVAGQERLFEQRKVEQMRRELEEQRKAQVQQIEERRARQVAQLMDQAQQHRKDGDLDSAINVLKQIVVIDPRYRPARWLMDEWEIARQHQRGRQYRSQFYEQTQRSLNEVEAAKIPWHEELRYPDDWPEISARPERQPPGASLRRSRLFGALDRQVPVRFVDEPLDRVLTRLAEAHEINLIVNWNDLKRAGVARDVPIHLNLPREISLKKALTEVLEQAGAGRVAVGFDVTDDALEIATQQTLDKRTYTAVYDINDLLMEIPMFGDAPLTDLTKVNQRANAVAGRASTPQTPWSPDDDEEQEEHRDNLQRSARVSRIIQLLQDTVAPESWYDRGGSIGTIKEINGQLVITQNTAAQRQVADLLSKLREQRAIQVAVEARFLTVTSNFLEEMGVDLDVVLNAGNAGFDFLPTATGPLRDPVLQNRVLLPRSFSRLGFTPATPAVGVPLQASLPAGQPSQPFGDPSLIPSRTGGTGSEATPFPIVSQVTAFTDPGGLASDVSGSFAGTTVAPAFSLFGSFLDNIQVDFLIRATQADSRNTVLTAPRLVLLNGQRSWVAVTIQQNFVSQLQPVVAAGAVAQAPTVDTIDSGAVLDVTATVTADKRYVTLTLRPGLTRLLNLVTVPFGGGTAAAFVQFPQLSSQRVATSVSVPDGGTLLIGGQKLAFETEIEAGVPVLSKIPILKRLYSSKSVVKDEQTLLILIKPKILIQAEQEELAFPGFGEG